MSFKFPFLLVVYSLFSLSTNLAHAKELSQETQQTNLQKNLQICVNIQKDKKRLACFDNIVSNIVGFPDVNTNKAEAQPQSVLDPIDEFGSKKPIFDGWNILSKTEPVNNVNEIELQLVKTSKFGYKKTRFYLSNGQIWDQIDSKAFRRIKIAEGQSLDVNIKKTALGSYLLRVNGKGQRVNVKRIK